MKRMKYIMILAITLSFSSCVSTKSVNVAREIQEKNGYRTHSLWYHGSTDDYHYFSQERENRRKAWFKVPFFELYVNKNLFFPYNQKKKIKVRISPEQPYVLTRREDKPPGKPLKEQIKSFPNTIDSVLRRIEKEKSNQ